MQVGVRVCVRLCLSLLGVFRCCLSLYLLAFLWNTHFVICIGLHRVFLCVCVCGCVHAAVPQYG